MLSHQSLESLHDHVLLSQFGILVRQDHESNAKLLRYIDAIDRRQLWAQLGHPSMFAFLVTRHHMSEATAGKRIGAARTARRFPVLFNMVALGEIHLSGIHRLSAHLTPENCEQVLAAAKHKTIRQDRGPRRKSRAAARRAVHAARAPEAHDGRACTCVGRACVGGSASCTCLLRAISASRLTSTTTSVGLTASGTASLARPIASLAGPLPPSGNPWRGRTRQAQATPGSARPPNPERRPRRDRRAKSTTTATARRTRYIEVAVRREAWTRDGGRCGFVGADGHRCNETRSLEFAHIHPWAKGGANTAPNLGLRCIAHNTLEADRDYGTRQMASKRRQKPLNLREPITRYIAHRTPFSDPGGASTPRSRAFAMRFDAINPGIGTL